MIKIRIMGKLKFFGLLLAAGMFAACSDNLENAGNENDGPKTGEGYVKVAINLPSVSGSRATDGSSVNLDDGVGKEYAVKGGFIAFFEGSSESDAKFVKAYGLGSFTQNDDIDDDHITTTISKILEAPLLSNAGNQMYALVILNPDPNISLNVTEGSLTLKNVGDAPGSDLTLTSESTLATLTSAKWNLGTNGVGDITSETNGFLMLNASLYNDKATPKTQTLVPVTVYATEQELVGKPAAQIFVERIVAKVDVCINTTPSTSGGNYFNEGTQSGLLVKDDGGIYTNDKVVFVDTDESAEDLGWILNVTNKNTRPLRDVSKVATWIAYNNQDFVGTASSDLDNWSRIYWTEDHNYDNTSTDFIIYNTTDKAPASWGGYSENIDKEGEIIRPQYCLENTAPYQFNNENNTTSVWIKAIYNFNPDAAAQSFFIVDKVGEIKNATEIIDYIKGILTDKSSQTGTLALNTSKDVPGGFYDTVEEYNKLFTGYTFIQEDVNKIGEIRYYKDGGCYYYAAPIKHFGQYYTPGDDKTKNDYQGRYGVVRNNWYQLTINSVSGPGFPGIDESEGEHVDDEEGYIKCEIKVLSWAKRSQDVDL